MPRNFAGLSYVDFQVVISKRTEVKLNLHKKQ